MAPVIHEALFHHHLDHEAFHPILQLANLRGKVARFVGGDARRYDGTADTLETVSYNPLTLT